MLNKSEQIDIWQIPLVTGKVDEYFALLSPHQQAKAERLINLTAKKHYIIAQAKMRIILAQYLSLPPDQITFAYGEHGKPYLPNHPVHFNLSHSNELAILAISSDHEVGIDIEYKRSKLHFRQIIERHFHPDEIAEFKNLPEDKQLLSFYQGWTSKEAYVKYLGLGMRQSFNTFQVNMKPDLPPKTINQHIHDASTPQIYLHQLDINPDYFATLATSISIPQLSYCHID